MTTKARRPRKRYSRRWPKARREAHSARMKELWADPTHVAKCQSNIDRFAEAKRAGEHTRAGVPTGYTKETVAPLWARAHELADRFIAIMKDEGELPDVDYSGVEVPETDAGKAEAALKEAFVLAVGPSDQKIKIQAINTVLNFTKSKPESKSKLTLNKAEDFLDAIANGDDA